MTHKPNWRNELKERLAKNEKEQQEKMKQWWNEILPREGSLLRQLVEHQLRNKL